MLKVTRFYYEFLFFCRCFSLRFIVVHSISSSFLFLDFSSSHSLYFNWKYDISSFRTPSFSLLARIAWPTLVVRKLWMPSAIYRCDAKESFLSFLFFFFGTFQRFHKLQLREKQKNRGKKLSTVTFVTIVDFQLNVNR